jgi:hypothetical protein
VRIFFIFVNKYFGNVAHLLCDAPTNWQARAASGKGKAAACSDDEVENEERIAAVAQQSKGAPVPSSFPFVSPFFFALGRGGRPLP